MRALQFIPAFLLLLGPLLFRFPARTVDFLPSLRFFFYESLEKGGARSETPVEWRNKGIRPYNAIVTRRGQDQFVVSPEREKKYEPDDLLNVPLHGEGYFVFGRVGREVKYFTREGELLWSKPYVSYPVSEPRGRVVFLFTGDANRVDIIDPSGNPAGAKKISGNFLTHHAFSMHSGRSAFVFGTGGLTVVDEKGGIVAAYNPEENLFFKSVALSQDGRWAAVHVLKQDDNKETDLIRVLELGEKVSVKLELPLERVIPGNIAMAVSEDSLAAGLPEKIIAASAGRVTSSGKEAPLRSALNAGRLNIVTGVDSAQVFLDGAPLATLTGPGVPFEILPGPVPGTFMMRSFTRIVIAGLDTP